MAVGLKLLHGIDTRLDFRRLPAISERVSRASGRQVAWQKSLVGEGAFTHEAGIHVDGLRKDRLNYQGVDPALLGREHRIILGKHSGGHAVSDALDRLGLGTRAGAGRRGSEPIALVCYFLQASPSEAELRGLHAAVVPG